MSTDFEQQLRERLSAAADHAPRDLGIDPGEVMAAGTRLVRRRRATRGGAALVTAGVLALAGWGALGAPAPGGQALPAGEASPSVSASARVNAAFPTDVGGVRYVVEVDRRPGAQPNVRYLAEKAGSRTQVGGAQVDLTRATTTPVGSGTGAERVLLGLLPAHATASFMMQKEGSTGGLRTEVQPLPGTAWQAVMYTFDSPSFGPTSYETTYWSDAAGVVRDGMGEVVPTGRLSGGAVVFVDTARSALGVFDDGQTALADRRPDPRRLRLLSVGRGQDGTMAVRDVALLPPGASAPRPTFTGATRDATTRTFSIPGFTGVEVRYSTSETRSGRIRSMTYTLDGRQVTTLAQ